jgi:phage terminase large subunit GpA-like protein
MIDQIENLVTYYDQLIDIIDSAAVKISDLSPSVWAEENIIMPKPFPGPLRYEKTPYTREIIDCFAPDHPAREIAVMGAAQFGKTASIIIPVIGYIIANDPGNIIMTVGHEDLISEAMDKIDAMLDSTGLRKMIKPTAQRAKSQKTGDTNTIKQFPNGYLKLSAAGNPKIWRQVDYKFGLIDDYEAVKGNSKVAGNIRDLIEKRFTAYNKTRKILYVSSPELEENSNIFEVYNLGDKRKFLVPCPCCGIYIHLQWSVEGKYGEMAGITWKTDDENKLITDSVGYICQECHNFFTDQNKSEYVTKGYWEPTDKPFKPEFYSYQMSSFYSPHGMSDWTHYVYKWLECHPVGKPRDERKYQTFRNLDEGLPYRQTGENIDATQLQLNTRSYEIGIIPEKMSENDGNGKIVLLTCAVDMGGYIHDGRLDYEVLAWAESGSTYSILHGSIGTFVPREDTQRFKADRLKWTYEHNQQNSVWPELEQLLTRIFVTDSGRRMRIFMTALDCGHFTTQAYAYVDNSNCNVVGVKGDKEASYRRFGIDLPFFKHAKERKKLYILEVGQIKDRLAELIRLKYDSGNDEAQPYGFMNYPSPSGGLYEYKNFFIHYEAEHRVVESKDGEGIAAKWVKKSSSLQNHFWDVRVYNMAIREIVVSEYCKEAGIKNYTWKDFVDLVMKRV